MMLYGPVEFSNVYFQCPKCGEKGEASQRKYLGGVNDRGGVILRCEECKSEFFLPLLNPSQARISSKFKIVKFLDFDFEEDIEESRKYKQATNVVTIVNEENFPLSKNAWNLKVNYPWDLSEDEKVNIYKCKNCNQSLEPLILEKVERKSLEDLNRSYRNYFNIWVKG
ncbi:MAG: hypothetical protein GXN97_05020, partial [Aquificae bacterium]|nr:hypothetical protein [Aquificota bacterium]